MLKTWEFTVRRPRAVSAPMIDLTLPQISSSSLRPVSNSVPKGCQIVSSPPARKNGKGIKLLRPSPFHERSLRLPVETWGQRNLLPEFNRRKSESHAMKNYPTRAKMTVVQEA
jgi:hypothetical protein